MKNIFKLKITGILILAAILSGCGAHHSHKIDKAVSDVPAQTMSEEDIKTAMQKAATPRAEHLLLKEEVGKWQAEVKFWTNPNKEPEINTGESVITMTHGDKFQVESFKGKWMGQPFTGTGYTGFDEFAGGYVSMWMDSASPSIHLMNGTYDAASKKWTYTGEATCPVSGAKYATRMTHQIINKDKRTLESFTVMPDGSEIKVMEILYTRAK